MMRAMLAACLAEKSPALSKAVAVETTGTAWYSIQETLNLHMIWIAVSWVSWPAAGTFGNLVAVMKAELVVQPLGGLQLTLASHVHPSTVCLYHDIAAVTAGAAIYLRRI